MAASCMDIFLYILRIGNTGMDIRQEEQLT